MPQAYCQHHHLVIEARLAVVQAELSKVERQMKNLLEAIEDMGLSPSLLDRLAKREAEKKKLRTEIAVLESLIVKTPDIPRITDAMIEEWLTYIRAALKSDDLETVRRAIRQFVSKNVIAYGEEACRKLSEFSIPEFPLKKHMDREALKQMITDLRAEGWSLRQIGDQIGLHFTRVRQILRA